MLSISFTVYKAFESVRWFRCVTLVLFYAKLGKRIKMLNLRTIFFIFLFILFLLLFFIYFIFFFSFFALFSVFFFVLLFFAIFYYQYEPMCASKYESWICLLKIIKKMKTRERLSDLLRTLLQINIAIFNGLVQ